MTAALDTLRDLRDPVVRLADLCDPGSMGPVMTADGAAAVTARLDGAPAVVFATDPRVQGGAMGRDSCELIVQAYETALAEDLPIVGIWQSGGARLAEGARSLDAVGRVFTAMTRASGVVPQISLVVGPAAGGAAYGPALTDVVVLAPTGKIFVTGPDVVRSVTGEDLDMEGLGGHEVHGKHSGVAHITCATEDEALTRTRRVTSLLSGAGIPVPMPRDGRDPGVLLPESRRRAYDVRPVVDAVLDEPGEELHRGWAPNIVTTLGRVHGRVVGVLANNPLRLGGCLNGNASEKAARFVRMCDALGIPLVVLVDVPGYLPGGRQEVGGIVRRGAKLLNAFAQARVPRVTVVLRKAYGGAYIAMNSKSLGASRVLAWDGAEVDVMDATAAIRVLRRRDLKGLEGLALAEAETSLAAEHLATTGGLQRAVDEGLVDEVIAPRETRACVAAALAAAPAGRGRHTNVPL
jgi:acetyl-CoA/propionyl-CoA carboxylase carboxyl transferase subunit